MDNVREALKKSTEASQRGDRAQAQQFLKQAQWEANNDQRWYACAAPLLSAAPGLTSPPPAAGGLVLTKTEITPAKDAVGGVGNLKSHYAYAATSASLDHTENTPEGKFVKRVQIRFEMTMAFSGTSGVLRPGDTITLTMTGTDNRTPMDPRDGMGLTGDVYGGGLEKVSSQSCWVGSGFSDGYHPTCRAQSVFRVPQGAEKVTISFGANGAMGTSATYTWEKPR
jgi:hypothetical protein